MCSITRGQAEGAHEVVIEDSDAARGDGTESQLLVTRHAELSHREHVERGVQRAGDFERDGNPASGQGEHDHVISPRVRTELRGEKLSGMAAVAEETHRRHPIRWDADASMLVRAPI